MNIKKFFIISVCLVTLVFLASCKDITAKETNREIKNPVEVTLIVKDDITRLHQVPAVFLAKNRANMAFQLSGTINHVMVKIGEKVEEGQALMSLYNPNIDSSIETSLANLESLKAKIFQVKRDLANLKELRKNKSASKNAFEQKETNLKDLMAQEKSINAQISLALANQSESIIKAPFDSSVVSINKQVGEFIAAGQSVIAVNQQSSMEVEVNITRSLWKNLNLGDSISAKYQEKEIKFKVVELAQTAESRSHLMKVVLELQSELTHVIGHQVIMSFPEIYQSVYKLPLEVVIDDGINQPYIFTLTEGQALQNTITPLYIENGEIIFSTVIDIADEVVIKGQSKISEGMKLQAIQ